LLNWGREERPKQNHKQDRKCLMARDLKPAKRPYVPPSFEMLDDSAAKAELEAKGDSKDANIRKMLSLIDGKRKKKKATSDP
jgi:hypothetical protein